MSLATRCSACATVFRVVQDQLRVSEGWVRCGRCNEVFNALENLVDLDAPHQPGPRAGVGGAPAAPHAVDPVDASDPGLVDRIEQHLFAAHDADRHAADAFGAGPTPAPGDAEGAALADEPIAAIGPGARLDAPPPPELAPIEPDAEPARAPEFVLDAERQARWQQPRTRAGLTLLALVFGAALLLQVLVHQRDVAAARWPGLRPMLAALCTTFGCRIEAPRRIDDISVESTTLTRAPGPDAFRLAVTLRNRGPLALALPSVDLSLTDTAGQLVARRALAPQDFRATSTLLQPGAEAALQLVLSAGTPKVTGYTVEIFYP